MATEQEIETRFSRHKLDAEQSEKVDAVLRRFKEMAYFINQTVPEGREKNVVLTKLEEGMFAANAGIARRTKIG